MRFTIGKKLGFSFAAVAALTLVAACSSYYELGKLAEAENNLTNIQLPILVTARDISQTIEHAGSTLKSYLLLSENANDTAVLTKDWVETWDRINKDATQLQQFHLQEENQRRVAALAAKLVDFHQTQQEEMALARDGSAEGKRRAIELMKTRGGPIAAEMKKLSTEMVETVNRAVAAARADIESARRVTTWMLFLSTAFVVLTGMALGTLVSRRIVAALAAMAARAKVIAAGDLTGRGLQAHSNDEIGDVTAALNEMQATLARLIQSIAQHAHTVANASEDISASATQATAGAKVQNDQVTQVATAVQEMSATVGEVSNISSQAAASARQAAEVAQHGGETVRDALASMRSIAASIGQTAQNIAKLGRSSDQIGKIIGVIDDIADQTNLLALNAAIEAARAGDQGRGFAVVADEVRKLAERTTSATQEITAMIQTVQQETGAAVADMQAGTKQVEVGVETTNKAGASLEEIIAASRRVGDMVTQIATAATQQASTTEQINGSMEQIAKITHHSAEGAEQSAKACQQLSGLALELQQLVSRFTTEEQQTAPGDSSRRQARPASPYQPAACTAREPAGRGSPCP